MDCLKKLVTMKLKDCATGCDIRMPRLAAAARRRGD
jgi:hypothetical protein